MDLKRRLVCRTTAPPSDSRHPPDFALPASLAGRVKQTRQRTLTNPLTIPPIQYLKYRPAENGVSVRGRWHALRTTAHDTCRVDQPHMNRWTDCKRVRYGEPATLCAAGTDMHLAAPLPYWATLNSCRQLLTLTGMDNVTAAWRRSDSHRLEAHLTLRRHTMLRVHNWLCIWQLLSLTGRR